MARLPTYVARKNDPVIDSIGFEEIIVGLIDRQACVSLDGLSKRLIKDGVRRKYPFTKESLKLVLRGLVRDGFID
jgi:hypothetical protein